MKAHKSSFFQEVTSDIYHSLEIEKTLHKSFKRIQQYLPADGLTFDIQEQDDFMISIARVTLEGVDLCDVEIPLSPASQQESKENEHVESVMIFNAPDLNPTSKDYARHFNMRESSNLVLNLDLGDDYYGSLAIYAYGQNRFTQKHAELLSQVKGPFSVAMSNALKYREVQKISENLKVENRNLYRELIEISGDRIIGAETGLKPAMTLVKQVAPVESPVLLLGDTGVGKDVIANTIHLLSERSGGPMVKINCGAIPENMVDSELFGHEKGSFTGAISQKKGKFERAQGGTLFLDEVAELSPDAQVRLLRAIQFKEIERVGGTKPIFVDARIIAATHRDLSQLIQSGRFREDLYFRLNVFPIRIPTLRDRRSDIPALVHHLMDKKARELNLYPPPTLDSAALQQLMDYDWPGNVRELSNIIERSLILNQNSTLSFDHLIPSTLLPGNKKIAEVIEADDIIPLDILISRHIQKALKKTHGRIEGPKGAARLLNLHPNTLRSKIKKMNISINKKHGQDRER